MTPPRFYSAPRRMRSLPSALARRAVAVGALAAAAAGCDDPLSVRNENQPIVDDVFATSTGTETITSRLFQITFSGMYGSNDAIFPQMLTLSGENESTVANFGMLVRGTLPRTNIDNAIGNAVALGNNRDFSFLSRVTRQAAIALNRLDGFKDSYTVADYTRNRAVAYFVHGYALGNLSLVYDSVGVVTKATAADSVPPFTAAARANEIAIAHLDTAFALATSTEATGATIPATWFSQTSAISMANFGRIIRTTRARMRAYVPRSPAENSAVNWAAVRDDAAAGIQSSFIINLNQGLGWTVAWLNQAPVSASWHQMPYWVIGMADTTGAYQTWLNAGQPNLRTNFLIRTPDRRFPSGETRAAQNAIVPALQPADTVGYFRNRLAGLDAGGGPTNGSFYDHFRFRGYFVANQVGPWPILTVAENDLLLAEAHIRLGNVAPALPLIDRYRTRNGLPALVGRVTAVSDLVPGGNACVPRTPSRSGSTFSLQCANVLEALKYEKRLETAFTGYGAWFFDGRRWGDLINGTPVEWPVPFNELNARNLPVYSNRNVAPNTNTYGWSF